MTVFVLSGFFCFTPLLIAACIICLTGNVYYNRTNEDGALAVWPRGNKTAAVIFLVLHGLIIWHWANRLFSSPDPEQVAAEVKQLILREWRQDPALQNSLKAIRHISLVHQGGGQYAGFLEATIDGNTVRMSLEVAYVRGYIRWQLKPLASVSPTTTERPTEGIGTTFTNSIGMTFTYIPAGEFLMGSRPGETDRAEDEHQHRVRITKPYYLGIHEVTQEQYEKVMGSNPSHFKGATLPVEMISWDDVQEFLSKLNDREKGTGREYRLPTEAEWEYACRAGTSSPFHYGSSLDTTQANFDGRFQHDRVANGDYRKQSTPVGTFKPNALGLFDMHGNVKEWCQDYYGVDYYNESHHHDPINEQKAIERVVRSGSWSCSSRYCRSAYRHNYRPDTRFDHLGFRVAVTVTHTKAP